MVIKFLKWNDAINGGLTASVPFRRVLITKNGIAIALSYAGNQ